MVVLYMTRPLVHNIIGFIQSRIDTALWSAKHVSIVFEIVMLGELSQFLDHRVHSSPHFATDEFDCRPWLARGCSSLLRSFGRDPGLIQDDWLAAVACSPSSRP